MIKVIIERHCKPGKEVALGGLLIDLRTKGLRQPGYVSGETLVSVEDPRNYLTIGTWTRLEFWKAWENSQERAELAQMIDALLAEDPRQSIYSAVIEQ